jgi:predicted tellurium resistance membrane protein TerC
MADSNSRSGGISFAGALTLLFIGLKLGHAINWSWWWVLAPLWISAAVALALFVMILLITITAALVSDDRRAGRRR